MKTKRARNYSFIAVLLFVTGPAAAQDTLALKTVEVVSPRVQAANTGLRTEQADSLLKEHFISGTLTDLLGQSGMLYVKSYGGGGLATTAVRGANAEQTPVIWNGLNLQGSTNGEVDLSLLPVFFFDNISFQPGSSSAGWGSGAIGGALLAGNKDGFCAPNSAYRYNLRATSSCGSFGDNFEGVSMEEGHRGSFVSLRLFRHQAINDFPFQNSALAGSPEMNLQHSGFFSEGGMADAGLRCGTKSTFTFHTWLQETGRDLPPTMLESESKSWERDYALRNVFDWKYTSEKWTNRLKTGFFHEGLLFFDGYTEPASNTDAWTGIVQDEIAFTGFKKWLISGGGNNTWNEAEVTQYIPQKQQNRTSVFLTAKFFTGQKLQAAVAYRQEQLNGKILLPAGEAGVDYAPVKWLRLQGNVARNYRIPTFNDLYWQPGGNPGLLPEKSLAEEGTIGLHFSGKHFSVQYLVTGFNRDVTDWLIWLPGPSYWFPQNLLKVWSRGVEHRLKLAVEKGEWKTELSAGYDYTRATNEKTISASDPSLHRQLIYVPQQRVFGLLQLSFRGWYIFYQQQYTDITFASSDLSSWLPSYAVADIQAGKRIDFSGKKIPYGFDNEIHDPRQHSCIEFFFRVNNTWNKKYQVLAWRPMPGRNFLFGFSFAFSEDHFSINTPR